jgi:hypothetical protein
MSRYYRTGEEERGYNERREEGRYASYPHSQSHEYREGWDDRERDERRERDRQEERREEEAARERAEERAQHELAMMRREEDRREEEITDTPPPVQSFHDADTDPHEKDESRAGIRPFELRGPTNH